MIYPWQAQQWQQSLQYLIRKRLPHAILLSGPSSIGKLEFCLSYIQRMNCTQPTQDNNACGICRDCHLFKVRTHPDVRMINVDESVDQIKVDQIKVDDIREINKFMSLSRQQGTYKIVCINQAELMNINTANALLKTLEEPPPNSILFLISHRANTLLATVKSRCQIWRFNLPDKDQAMNWLQQRADGVAWETLLPVSGNRPLLALALHETGLGEARAAFYHDIHQLMQHQEKVTTISAKLQNEDLEKLVTWQQAWCADLVRCHYKKEPVTIENPDIRRSLHSLIGRVDLQLLFSFWDKLIELRRFSSAPLNKRLFIENMLIRCQEILQQPLH